MKKTFLQEYETKKALADFIMQTDKLSMGVKCAEFEQEFSKKQICKESILVNSGASANLSLLQALKNLGRLKQGDSVGFSALTWSTNLMPIIQMGFNPIPIDCDPSTLNVMSHNLAERLQKNKLTALFITNALGFSGDLGVIREICQNDNIILLEDNCEALGTELPQGRAGNFGLASTFSFFVAHHMSTIEGGMVCTNDEELAEMIRITRANGWDRNLTTKQQSKWRKKYDVGSEFQSKYTFYDLAFNIRPTEITGFLGISQLKFLDSNVQKREQNHLRFEPLVKNNPDFILPDRTHIKVLSPFAFPVICKNQDLKEKYMNQFCRAEIEIRPMIAGNIQHQPFYRKYIDTNYLLPGTDFLHNNSFYCGNYPELTEADLETISNCLSFNS